jgi:hypothetical protein
MALNFFGVGEQLVDPLLWVGGNSFGHSWATGWVKGSGPRPAAYLNIF